MQKIFTLYFIFFLFLSITVRPILPALIHEINICNTDANNSAHSLLVHLLLKNIEKEKEKYSKFLQASISASPLGLLSNPSMHTRTFVSININNVVVYCCSIISNNPNAIFQPPEFLN